ncbi:MAG: hypothetical protein FWD57_16960 [Polyangiaceae bacterium]|nr:hypothetical protein [Polyangiaceae bacterium]
MLAVLTEVVHAHIVLSVKRWDEIGSGTRHAGLPAVRCAIFRMQAFEHDLLMCGRRLRRARARTLTEDSAEARRIAGSVSGCASRGDWFGRTHPSVQLAVAGLDRRSSSLRENASKPLRLTSSFRRILLRKDTLVLDADSVPLALRVVFAAA